MEQSRSDFKKALPALFGNTLEAYDFCLYGLLAPVFAKVFFPSTFKYSLISSFFLFSIAYIARPFGAIFWGVIADKYGRKPVLMGTITLMAIPAVGMAVTPSYESIGITACIIVIVLRLLQGIAFGGELPTVMVNVYELSPSNKKGFFGSLCDFFGNSGYLIGLCLLTLIDYILSPNQMTSYGWRFLFLLSIIFIFILSYIRFNLVETMPVPKRKIPFSSFDFNIKPIILIALFMSIICCLYYNLFFYNHILIQEIPGSFSPLVLQTLVIFIYLILVPMMGLLSDRINRFKWFQRICISLMFFSIPIYQLLVSKNFMFILLGYFFYILYHTTGHLVI